jgi:hypothetical protein
MQEKTSRGDIREDRKEVHERRARNEGDNRGSLSHARVIEDTDNEDLADMDDDDMGALEALE